MVSRWTPSREIGVPEQVLIISTAGRAFRRPWGDLRRVAKRFVGGLAKILLDPLQTFRRASYRRRGKARVKARII